ncbi:hypothetical protein F965_00466 [Acinetobacter schindleri NIPH 900]|uniref:HTH cro/C1-type domain-containing protein n=1 Tax=Acinetobacter schindleri NIPH 900 TaxID=1217675 RepID=N8Y3K5_9GAMM|nr:helix-turn-helix transcriptional regulator [Acinetobacter schindleri]ENV14223.1 hypothetical protein F965_00466 [Acinetobacter schindleri NIPH 900]
MNTESKYKKLGIAIKTAMTAAEIRHKDLIELISQKKGEQISKGTLSHWISGKTKPSRENLEILCDILDLNPRDFFIHETGLQLTYKFNSRAPWYDDIQMLIEHLKSGDMSTIYKTIPTDIAYFFEDNTARVLQTQLSIFGSVRDVTLYINQKNTTPSPGYYLIEIGALKGIRELRIHPVTSATIIIDLEGNGGTEEYIVSDDIPLTVLGRAEFVNIRI